MRKLAVAMLFLTLAAGNIAAQTNNPAEKPDEKRARKPDPTANQGVRKLSRREKKERIKNLAEKYRTFLKEVEPIILDEEINAFLVMESDPQRDLYIEEFWRRRDSDPKTAYNEFRDTYTELLVEAKEKFRNLISDRSRVYLIHGRPLEILKAECDRYLQPIEIWLYARLPHMGSDVALLFYVPRNNVDYRLFLPMDQDGLSDLLSVEGQRRGGALLLAGGRMSPIWLECPHGEEILKAVQLSQMNKYEAMKLFTAPEVNTEDVNKIVRASVIANPSAPKLAADASTRFPGKRGARTSAEITVTVLTNQLTSNEVNGARFYNLDITGEVLKDEKLFETYRYRFDFPAETQGEKIALVLERFLRPANYQSRIKVVDVNSGAEAIVEQPLAVPYLEDAPEKVAREREASTAVDRLQDEFRVGESRLRIAPLGDELLTGLHKIETLVTGTAIETVEFYLDGKKIMVKRDPPYTLELDLGTMPKVRRIRAVALDREGRVLSGDEVVVNMGLEPFHVRIVSPRVALDLRGRVRVEMEALVPPGKELEHVELYLNETKLATLYDPPFVQTIDIPDNLGIGYLRAVAKMKEESIESEDLVFINTPEFMQEIDVHLVELPTTVIASGRHVTDLPKTAFKVLDEGKLAEIAKFEYVKNLPLNIGMAVDASGSMQTRMMEAQKAGGQFFKSVLKPGDRAFVVSFDQQPAMIQKWTRMLADLSAGLASLRAEESTALYDAIVYSLYYFQGIKGQKALVVITDGKDSASKFSFDQSLEYARRAAIPIYFIAIGIRSTEFDTRYKLGKFAAETGGATHYIEKAAELGRIYDDIQNELRSQYILGIYPPAGVASGSKWREVSVVVDKGKAKTIRGYYP
ncbi:MAG TPA: VWA domain-containing protein [Thermoanaerobaculia bacterium]